MKKKFSIKWKESKQPRKQRKFLVNAPLHLKRKFLSSTLSKELRAKYKRRSISIRKGDEVLVMRGKMKKKKGKVISINIRKMKVAVEGLQMTKKDGTKVNLLIAPSKLKITSLNLEDRRRLKRNNKTEKEEKQAKNIEKEKKNLEKSSKKIKSEKKENAPEKK